MAINRERPHVLVLPADDANRQIVNGFVQHPDLDDRRIQVFRPAGGWSKVVRDFKDVYIDYLRQWEHGRIVLLVDFDEKPERRYDAVKQEIPEELVDRVFVIGVLSRPERLKSEINLTYEKIGLKLANDCVEDTNSLWGHDLLKHNQAELDRMISSVRPFLFQ